MRNPKDYRVSFEIDVYADSSEEAAKTAWRLLSDQDALLPIARVIEKPVNKEYVLVDLNDHNEKEG